MTVVIGVLCEDGVVIGSDSAVTFVHGQIPTIEQKGTKIRVLTKNNIVLCGTGSVGLSQRFRDILKNYFDQPANKNKSNIQIGKELCVLAIQDFQSTGINKTAQQGYGFGALIAFSLEGKRYLCEFAISDFQPEFKFDSLWYVSMGSGQLIADPFLGFVRKLLWENHRPNVNQGILGTVWALQHTIDINAGGINAPVQIGTLTKENGSFVAKRLAKEEVDQHIEHIRSLEKQFKENNDKLIKDEELSDMPTLKDSTETTAPTEQKQDEPTTNGTGLK